MNEIDAVLKSMSCIGILITDGEGNIIQADSTFDEYYGVSATELLHKNVYDLEKQGLFRPSSVAMVMETRQEVTVIQKVRGGQDVIVTAIPVFDNSHNLIKVITFSRDFTALNRFQCLYDEMLRTIDHYSRSIDELSYEKTIIEDFHTSNGKFQQMLMSIQKVARYDINVLLCGETGVGKTLLAKKIHRLSNFKGGRFVEINCGAMPENLIESELFGYEKGAYTGADPQGKQGLFEVADQGTLFLDEVSEIPLQSQVKLLKVLQDQEMRRIGGTKTIRVNCRLICAANKDLDHETEQGRFRQDLLYRLNVVSFRIPPLRERPEDIITLSRSMLARANEKYGFKKKFDRGVYSAFLAYHWPGNIRELENTVCQMSVMAEGEMIIADQLPEAIVRSTRTLPVDRREYLRVQDLPQAVEAYESAIVREVFAREGSSTRLAKALNISQATAARKIRKYVREDG